MKAQIHRLIVIAFLLTGVSASSVVGQGKRLIEMSADEREQWTGSRAEPPHAACSIAKPVPAIGLVLDVDQVAAAASSYSNDGYVLMSADVDSIASTARILEATVDDSVAAAVLRAVRDGLRQVEVDEPTPFRVRLDVGHEASVRLVGSVNCMPEIRNRDELQRELARRAAGNAAWRNPRFPRTTSVMARVTTTGEVETVRLETTVGDLVLDRLIADLFRTHARFTPATVDGEPLAVWSKVPVSIGPSR